MSITMNGVELGVEITEKAAEKIKYFAAKDGISENVGLRVAVKGGGCSGMTYDLDITILDFSDGLNGKGFSFDNPNAKKACGCGTSFSV